MIFWIGKLVVVGVNYYFQFIIFYDGQWSGYLFCGVLVSGFQPSKTILNNNWMGCHFGMEIVYYPYYAMFMCLCVPCACACA